MKAVLALFLIFAAASATLITDWKNCGAEGQSWTPISLNTEKSENSEDPCSVSICGKANVPFTANGYNLNAKKFGLSIYSKKGNIRDRTYEAEQEFCFDYTFKIPSLATHFGSFDLEVSALDTEGNVLGCMEFDSDYLF